MRLKKNVRVLLLTVVTLLVGWGVLTLYVEFTGPAKQWTVGDENGKNVLIVFDPDPFYDLDEQVCMALANALAEEALSIKIATVAAARSIDRQKYDIIIYCANTYNWRPDWSITNYIEDHPAQERQSIVAITLGAGSTESSQRSFEKVILRSGGKLLNSYSLWLWRPNDMARLETSNVEVAKEMAYQWGTEIAKYLKASNQ
jgi:hypothetical protein